MERFVIRVCCIITITIMGWKAEAQDGHYWTHQYGTESILLSNSVIGGVEDLGAVYYNPGRLALIDNPAFLLNANVFEYNHIKIEDAAGDGASRSETSLNGVPNFVAGTFKLKFLEGHYFAYSVIQRQLFDLDFDYRTEITGDVIEGYPGEELLGSNIRFSQNVNEQWYSISWAYPFSEKLSIGITTSAARLAASKGTLIELQALTSDNQVAQYKFDRDIDVNHFGLLWKIGLAGEAKKFNWGITITTPSITLGNNGEYDYQEFLTDLPPVPYRYATSIQEPSVTYKRPFAVGGGISVPINRSQIHLSGEWYNSIDRYTLLEAEPHISQTGGDTISFALIDELKSVFNIGIGSELYLTDKASLFLSAGTDFSAAPTNNSGFSEYGPVANNSVLSADFLHFAAGVSLNIKGAVVTLGATHTGARQDFNRVIDFPDGEGEDIFEQDYQGTLNWDRVRLVFSFSVPFLWEILEEHEKDN